MPAAIDATGHKYGRLTALDFSTKNGLRIWRFSCECGAEYRAHLGHVRSGKSQSCGCFRREATGASRFIDRTGQRVGRLAVLHLAPTKMSHARTGWVCRCDCGEEVTKSAHALGKKNPTLSCGCLQRETIRAIAKASKKDTLLKNDKAHMAARRKKRRSDPVIAVAERMSRMLCWALAGVNAVKSGATFDALGYTPSELKAHLEKQFTEGMTWGNRNEWEIDHITPISSARTPEDVLALNQLWNLRPLWAKLNNSKNNRRDFLI